MRASDTLAKTARGSGARHDLDVRAQVKAVVAGLVGGLLALSAAISYPAVVFTGELERFLPIGIGLAIFSTAVLAAVTAWLSSLPGVIANAQLETGVVLGIIGSSVVPALGPAAPDEVLLGTFLLVIVLASLSFGLVMLVLGVRGRANLVRYIPFPVIGGFFVYLVWLLLSGGMLIMIGRPLGLDAGALLFQPDQLSYWLPGLLVAVALFALQKMRPHYLNAPMVLVAAVVLFWLVAWSASISPAELQAAGYLLPSLSGREMWSPVFLVDMLRHADWRVALSELPQLVALWLVGMITLLLIASSLEVATRSNIDLNQELKAAGVANLLCGLGGGLPGYASAAASLLPHSMGAMSRLVGLVVALVSASALFFASGLLAYVPRQLLGLVLIYLAIDLAAEVVVDRWTKMPRVDRALMALVFACLVGFGFLPGIAIGILAGLAVFAFSYARIDLVHGVGSAARFRSNVSRPASQLRALHKQADAIEVVCLQGYVFFGSAHSFLQRIKAMLGPAGRPPPRFLILDFSRVDGADSSALFAFARLLQQAQEQACLVLFAGVPPALARSLLVAGLTGADGPHGRVFVDLDHALEHAENVVLEIDAEFGPQSGLDELEAAYPGIGARKEVLTFCEQLTWQPGDEVVRQGEPSDAMFFVESGRLTAWRERADGGRMRLRTIVPGTVVGEVGFYLHAARAASVVADRETCAFRITREALRRMQRENPALASMFHRFMATIAAERAGDNARQLAARSA